MIDPRTNMTTSTKVRRTAWTALAAFSVLRFALLQVTPQTWGMRVFAEFAYVAPIVAACLGAVVVARVSSGLERRFWSFLAGSLGLMVLTETYLSYYSLYVDAAGPTIPAPFELLQLGALALFFVMVVRMARFGAATRASKARFFVGAAAGLVALFVAALEFISVPMFEGVAGVSEVALVVCAACPVMGIAMLASTFGVLFGGHPERWRTWERLVIASLLLYAVGLIMMPFWYRGLLTDVPQSAFGALTDVAFSAGPYLFFMAALYRLTSDDPSDALAPGPRLDESPGWLRILYPVLLALLVPLIGVHALSHAGEPHAATLLLSALLLASLLMLRSFLASLEVTQHQQLSSQDPLTGLDNERSLRVELPAQVADAKRYGGDLAFVVLDIDDLTRVNDLFGHPKGDETIRDVASALADECSQRCSLYRVGSDEFALTAPGMDAEKAAHLAQDLCARVEREVDSEGLKTTLSAGVTSLQSSPDADALITDAFAALQGAKMLHRGSVEVYASRMVMPGPFERLELARKEAYLATVRALAAAVDARDPASREHSSKVGKLARELGEELGFDPLRASALETTGFVHDIGKLALPDELLWKHGTLTEDDRARLREHVELGERILRSTELAFMLPWVRAHHERWDGAGYPDGLSGEAIPLEARIIAVCDSYDAMTSGISHESRLSHGEALQELELGAGSQFDPAVIEAFMRVQSRAPGAQSPAG